MGPPGHPIGLGTSDLLARQVKQSQNSKDVIGHTGITDEQVANIYTTFLLILQRLN